MRVLIAAAAALSPILTGGAVAAGESETAHQKVVVTPEVLLKNALNFVPDNGIDKFTWSGDSAGILIDVNRLPEPGTLQPGQMPTPVLEYVDTVTGKRRPMQSGKEPETSQDGRIIAYSKGESWPYIGSVVVAKASGEQVCEITAASVDPQAAGINSIVLSADGRRIAVAIGIKQKKPEVDPASAALPKKSGKDAGFDENPAAGEDRLTVEVHTDGMNWDNHSYNDITAVWSLDTRCGDKRRLAEIPKSYAGPLRWARGRKQLIATVHQPVPALSHGRTDLIAIDTQDGSWRAFKENIGGQGDGFLAVSPDGEHVAFTYDDDGLPYSHREQIAIVSTKDGAIRRISGDLRDGVQWLDGENLWLVALAPHSSLTRAVAMSLSGKESFIADLPGSARPSPDLRKVAWLQNDHYGASTLWIADLQHQGDSWEVRHRRRLVDVPAVLERFARGERRLLACKSKGVDIAGMLVLPLDYQQGQRYPLIVDIHGGPTGGLSSTYSAYALGAILNTTSLEHDLWAAKGYAVLAPDYRASGMYGFDNVARDGAGTADDFKDIMCQVDKLVSEGIADNDRMAVIGHSYGGVETNWIVTHSNRFRSAISYEGGLGDWFLVWAMGGTVNMVLDRQLGSALAHPERYQRMSVLEAAKGATIPTLFISAFGGEVKADVYDWMFAAWRYQGIEAQYRIYHDEGHVLQKPTNQRDLLLAAIEWIDRHMQPRNR